MAGAAFLDLFAGSGIVGLEALSRGAGRVLMVERRGRGLTVLQANCRQLDSDGWRILAADLPRQLGRVPAPGSWELVFADPPYGFSDYEALLEGIAPLLAKGARLAIEHSIRDLLPDATGGLSAHDRREYGDSALTFFRGLA